jgi:cytochrome c biogenesis protein
MATSETDIGAEVQPEQGEAATEVKVLPKRSRSPLDWVLEGLSSVRFGVTMLIILLVCAMIGMLVMQQDVDGFQDYYKRLTPAQRDVYGFFQLFSIYHSWYFALLLAITGLNIILASIDRFPTAWQYVKAPKLDASPNFIRAQAFNAEADIEAVPEDIAERVKTAWGKLGFRSRVSEQNGRLTVFAQRNVWNRLGAYAVHVALLIIATGFFLTNRFGEGGSMEIKPGVSSKRFNTVQMTLDGPKVGQKELPFTVECTDLQQKLVRPEGGLDTSNTIDWLSYIKIKDGPIEFPALVHLNFPYDYRGYRFFQSSFVAVGNAREVTLSFEPFGGGDPLLPATIKRGGFTDVPGIGRVEYKDFYPDLGFEGGLTTLSADYNNPAAELQIRLVDGKSRRALACNPQLADELLTKSGLSGPDSKENLLVVNGYKILLRGFEKAAQSHTLTVQYDPGRIPFYVGSALLLVFLCGVFFFSHQRVWAVIESGEKGAKVFFGGNVNRNKNAFEDRFRLLVECVTADRRREA